MATIFWRGIFVAMVVAACRWAVAGEDGDPCLPALPATTVQLPTFGISIDAEGTLDARTFREFDGKLLAERLAAAKAARPGDLWARAKLRKVSLPRLETAIAAEIAAGRRPD